MTRPAAETDATKGGPARSLAERAISMVDTRTRKSDPFAARPSVGSSLRYSRSRDPETTPGQAIAIAIERDVLLPLPRPGSGRPCLTVRDGRRVAACCARYQAAGEPANVDACRDRLAAGLPTIHPHPEVRGP